MITIADIAAEYLKRNKDKSVGYGDLTYMHDIYDETKKQGVAKCRNLHPLNLFQRVLNALETKRGKQLFIKEYYRLDFTGVDDIERSKLCRVFTLKEQEQ